MTRWLQARRAIRPGRCAAAGLAACLLSPSGALAGAWALEEGRTQIIFSATAIQAPTRFDRRGRSVAGGRFSKQETAIQAERGHGDGLTSLAGGVLRSISFAQPPVSRETMAGALSAGLRARLWTDGTAVLSLQATAAIAGERSRPRGGRMVEAPAEAEVRLLYGHGSTLWGMPVFAEAQAGYRWRGGGHPDEVLFDATLGIRPLPRLLLLLQSFNAAAIQPDRRFGGGRMRRHKLQPSLVWDFGEGWSLQVGAFVSPAGRETVREQGALLALWRRF